MRERRGNLLRAALAGERPPLSSDPAAAASLLADGLLTRDGAVLVALESRTARTMVDGTPP
jgi:hypothetical protein